MSLIFRLSWRNLFHDRLRFIATVIGIVFSIVLVTVQMGLFLSFDRMVTTMIDHAPADLWIVPLGTKCFEDPSLVDERERFRALSINGIGEALQIVVGFAQWRLPSGGTTPVFIVSSDTRVGGLRPWNLVEGSLADLGVPGAVAIDQSYFDRLGTKGLGASAEIRDQKVEVTVVTKGIRAFTTTPYVFTSLDQARAYVGTPPNKATYFLVRLAPDADVESVRSRLRTILSDSEVLTPSGDISAMGVRAELDERDFGESRSGKRCLCARPLFATVNLPEKVLSISPIVQSSRISSRDQRNLTDVSVAEVVVDLVEPGPLAVGMKVDLYFRYDKPRQ